MTQSDTETAGPALVLERDGERAAIAEALRVAGSLLVLEGPPGVGKSTLLAGAIADAREQGALVLEARGTTREREVAFGVAVQLFGPVLAALPAARRSALLTGAATPAAGLFGPGPATEHGDAGAIARALGWLLESLAADRPGDGTVVLALDDAHWADAASLRFLAHVAGRLADLPLTVLVAIRSGEAEGDTGAVLTQLRADPAARLLRPAPLSEDGVARLVRAAFPEAADPFVAACARVTGGNPFLVHALNDALRAEGVAPDAEASERVAEFVPDAVVRSTLVRLSRMPEPAVRLAVGVAVLGDDAPLAHAAALAGLDEATAAEAADALSWAHLLAPGEPLRFTHPLIAAAVHDDIPADLRSRAHRTAARLLADEQAPPDAIAAHLVECEPAGDAWTVSILRSAAQRALDADEPRAAARFLRRACEEPPPYGLTDLGIALAQAEAAAGLPGADARLSKALDLIDEPRRRAQAVVQLARLLAARADFSAAADAAGRTLAELDPRDPLADKLLAVYVDASSRQGPRRQDALRRLEPMVADARARRFPADPAMQARLASRMAVGGTAADRATARELAEAALLASPLVDEDFHGVPLAWATGALYWLDELERARDASTSALDAAQRRGSTIAVMCASIWLAGASLQLGDLTDGIAVAEHSLGLAREGWTALVGWLAPTLVVMRLERDEVDAARRALEVAERQVKPDALDHGLVLEARGRLALHLGDPAGALEAFRAAGRHLAEGFRITNPALSAWRSQAALAAAQLGEKATARDLVADELEAARRAGTARPLGTALRVGGRLLPGRQGLALLDEAVTVLQGSAAALERAHALVDHGVALAAEGDTGRARERLRDGLDLAERFDARVLVRRAEDQLKAAGGRRRGARPSGAAALTPAELRIATLAAQGRSNREIASELFLTTKTVEWHLGNVYAKLGVRTRRDLPHVLTGTASAGRPDGRAR